MIHTPLSHATRVAIVERHCAGESLTHIAADLHISMYTARTYWRAYRTHGWTALPPTPLGPPATGPLGRAHPRIKYVLLRLKRQHPGWGVDKLRLELTRRPSLHGIPIPQRTALAAYLASFGARLARPRHRPTQRPVLAPPGAVQLPHQCWQIDFTGDTAVAGLPDRIAPFMVCDRASGAPLAGIIHHVRSRGNRHGMTARTVQADLRQVFTRWGLPDAIQMDRDSCFVGGTRLEWPGCVILWLVGLAIRPIINRAYRPTDNAIVERNHQTWTAHVVMGQTYHSLRAVQIATDQAFADRRTALPSRHPTCAGHPFLDAFPSLATPRRPYTPEHEAASFDLARVDAFLAQWRWERTVDRAGKISLADQNYPIGRQYARQIVRVRFDPTTRRCCVTLIDGTVLQQLRLPVFEAAYIRGLNPPDPLLEG